jgi:glycosyltransferase involved in cell wall biosynthesis
MSATSPIADRVAFVVKGYPRLSESFIAQEIAALEQRGLDILIVSLRHPTDPAIHPIHDEIKATILYLPEYLYQEPLRVIRAWNKARHSPGYEATRNLWLEDLRRDRSVNRIRRFGQALVLGCELMGKVRHLHAHFLHTPASVARYASTLMGIPWSCSAHAKDIWTTPMWEKRQKLAECAWLTTCTHANFSHLCDVAANRDIIKLNYHGLDLRRFPLPDHPRPPRAGRDSRDPVVILSVGRAVDKKGYDDLLRALGQLPLTHQWQFVHIGDGDRLPALKRLGQELGIAQRLRWLGALSHHEVLAWYRRADIFALACRVSANGDRDGLPNVLLEALSQRLAVLSTKVAGIPELIDQGEHGVIVPQRDIEALARALDQLIGDPDLRMRLGEAGSIRVRDRFSLDAHINGIAAQFGVQSANAA